MPTPPTTVSDLDREDPDTARRIVEERVLADPAIRPPILDLLIAAIQACQPRPAAWSLKLAPYEVVLNAGWGLILKVKWTTTSLAYDDATLTDKARDWIESNRTKARPHVFHSSGNHLAVLPTRSLATMAADPDLRRAVLQGVQNELINKPKDSRIIWWEANSPGLLAYLEQHAGTPISYPDYSRAATGVRNWKISPGEGARLWNRWSEEGFVTIGWPKLGDLRNFETREDFESARSQIEETDPAYSKVGCAQVWQFAHISEGDRIVANRGTREILGVGTVTGSYEYDHGDPDHPHRLPVRWDVTDPIPVHEKGWRRTLIELGRSTFQHLVGERSPVEPTRRQGSYLSIVESLRGEGLFFRNETLSAFLLALQTKRFMILSGISGTGKTQLALRVAQHFASGPVESDSDSPAADEVICVVAVRPDWTDNRALLGFLNPLTERYVATPFLRLLMAARREQERANREGRAARPHFVILDEMNLARVEQYFSDLLSTLESGEDLHLHDSAAVEAGSGEGRGIPRRLEVPGNLWLIGTVNVDESTYMFSPKVLDRAFTMELNEVDLSAMGGLSEPRRESTLDLNELPEVLLPTEKPKPTDWARLCEDHRDIAETVVSLHQLLAAENRHFGYRVANEIARFVLLAEEQAGEASREVALDLCFLQKVLPKLHGSQQEMEKTLDQLFAFAVLGGDPSSRDVEDLRDDEAWEIDPRGRLARPGADPDDDRADPGLTADENQGSRVTVPAFPRTAAKLLRMRRRLSQQGFTAYIE